MDIQKVVVVGTGTMGSGIAYVTAMSGYEVEIVDQEQEYLDNGMSKIKEKVKEGIERNKMSAANGKKLIDRINTNLELEDAVKDADLIIEAVFEDLDVKRDVFSTLSENAQDNAILATNTSTISITKIAEAVDDPSRVVGLHFFNPPEAMKLIEVVLGEKTSDETKEIAQEFADDIGKTPIPCKDSPGFIVNRLLIPMLNEAVKLLDEDVAEIEDIDQAAVMGADFPAGPFALADMVGLDVALAAQRTLHEELGDCYKPSPTLVELVEEGKLGMKTGEGFHDYS